MNAKPQPVPVPDERQALDEEAIRTASDTRLQVGKLIRVLVRVDGMRLYDDYGYSSLFAYCTKRLRMSEGEAGLRITAVRKVHEVPELLPALEDGRLTLTNVSAMKPLLRPGNAKKVIDLFTHKSKLEAQEIVAREHPKPPQKNQVRKMPTPRTGGYPGHHQAITPHAADLYKLIVMITGLLFAKSQRAFDLTKRANPHSDLAVLLDQALDLLIKEAEKNLLGCEVPEKPRNTTPSKNPHYVTKATKRAVWKRDGGQCRFIGKRGGRCIERARLEFDHVDPRARGGKGTVENTRLLCYAHHKRVTEETFGPAFIDVKIAQRQQQKDANANAKAKAKAKANAKAYGNAKAGAPHPAAVTSSTKAKPAKAPPTKPKPIKKAAPRGARVASSKKTKAGAQTDATATVGRGG